jgi:STE24 endopeptidase
VPDYLADSLDSSTYALSVSYTLCKGRFSSIGVIYSSAWIAVLVLGGCLAKIDAGLAPLGLPSYTQGVLYVLLISFIFSLIDIPLSLYGTFVIEERFGFNKMTIKLWLLDLAKSLALSALLLTPVLYGLFWFMNATGPFWWLYAAIFLAVIQLALIYIFPVWIAPLFNKFTPLPEGSLRGSILALTERLSFRTAGIFMMDGSKRSRHGNAYFTGLGANKRIVLYDTLINSLSEEQVVSVLAHEIGHQKKHHTKKLLLVSLALTFAGFWVLSQLMLWPEFYQAFGFREPAVHGALVIFIFLSGPFVFFLSPLLNALSRRFEYQADAFAVAAVGDKQGLKTGLIELSKKNLSNLTPHPLYSFFHYSHPTLLERIGAIDGGHGEPQD